MEAINQWLGKVLGEPVSATVDSAAIARVFDLLHSQGCFVLGAQYALFFELEGSKVDPNAAVPYLTLK